MQEQPTVSAASPHFKMVFLACLGITALCLIVMVAVAFIKEPTRLQENLFEYCKTIVSAGVGAIFGLIGGKVT